MRRLSARRDLTIGKSHVPPSGVVMTTVNSGVCMYNICHHHAISMVYSLVDNSSADSACKSLLALSRSSVATIGLRLRVGLREGGGPQVGEVTRLDGVTCLSV